MCRARISFASCSAVRFASDDAFACIRVPSIAKAVDAVKQNDGTVSVGPHEVPGGDHIVIGNDPQGAEFALVGKA